MTNFQLELGSTATPYAPYSNICPITGHTELNLVHTGKNLFEVKPFSDWTSVGSYKALKKCLPANQSMVMSFSDKDTTIDISDVYLGFLTSSWSGGGGTAPSTSDYRWCLSAGVISSNTSNRSVSGGNLLDSVFIYPNTETAYNKLFARYNIQIELGSSATTYEPYTGSTTTTDFGTTVYGGTLEGVSGVVWLTVDRAIVDLGSLFYTYYEYGSISGGYSNTLENVIKKPTSGSAMSDSISDKLVQYSDNQFESSPDNTFAINTYGRIKIHKSGITNATELKNALSGYMLVYPLATPITTQLTPQEVKSLLGSNNIYHDCNGDIEVVYRTSSSTIPGTFIEDNQHKARIGKEFINSEDFIEI
ncbi:MAG: hypothetical protein IKF79_09000 [Methanosphaera sp.]|nr:hypothetical protein [Methanosphaera sp.]